MTAVIVVGNPKPRSRTFEAAQLVVRRLTGADPDMRIDLTDLGPALLDWTNADVAAAIATVHSADLVVVASPTYKGSYTGLLKLFLDRIGAGALAGVTAVPLMLGGDLRHSLAHEVLLKPILTEIGATCPTRGLFLIDSEYAESAALDEWLELARRQVVATAGALR
jgi:FMN reductase